MADDTDVIRGDSAGDRGSWHDAVIGSMHKPVVGLSFLWMAWDTDWVRLNWKKRPIGGDRGGVLGTVVVDIEVIKDD